MLDKQIKDIITVVFFALFILYTPDVLLVPVAIWGTILAVPLIEQIRKNKKR